MAATLVRRTLNAGGPLSANSFRKLRQFLLAVILLGLLGTGAELLLLDHYETALQYTPLLLIGFAILVVAWLALNQQAAPVRVWRGLMILFLISGVAGFYLHMQAKIAFTSEVNPSLSGLVPRKHDHKTHAHIKGLIHLKVFYIPFFLQEPEYWLRL